MYSAIDFSLPDNRYISSHFRTLCHNFGFYIPLTRSIPKALIRKLIGKTQKVLLNKTRDAIV